MVARGLAREWHCHSTHCFPDGRSTRMNLPALLECGVETEAAVLISCGTDGDPWGNLILPHNDLALCRGHITGKSNEEVSGDSLLHGNDCAGGSRRTATGQYRVNGKLRNARNLSHSAGDLTTDLRSDCGHGCLIPRSGICGNSLGCLTKRKQVDDVCGRQRRVRGII